MHRREFIKIAAAGASITAVGGCSTLKTSQENCKADFVEIKDGGGDSRIRGAFPILSTPYTESGAVDYEVLDKEARFIADCKCQ